jgi:hypothetical protein
MCGFRCRAVGVVPLITVMRLSGDVPLHARRATADDARLEAHLVPRVEVRDVDLPLAFGRTAMLKRIVPTPTTLLLAGSERRRARSRR